MSRRTSRKATHREQKTGTVPERAEATRPARTPPTGRAWGLAQPLLIACAVVCAYVGSLGAGFVYDDATAILDNNTIRNVPGSLSTEFDSPMTGRPIVNLSLALNYAAGGLDPWGYHVANVAIHILVALLLYTVVRRALLSPLLVGRHGEDARDLAFAVALLWAVHPLHTATVTYATQRTELLMALFFLSTLYCLQRGVESARGALWYAAGVASCAAGTASKEVMVVAPLVVLAYDRLLLSPSFAELFRRRWQLYAGLAATWLIFAALAPARMRVDIAVIGMTNITPWHYLLTQSGVIVHYLRLAVWPSGLVGDYSDWPVASSVVTILPWGAIVLGLLGATAWACRRHPALGFLGVWFFFILAPTSSVWPVGWEAVAERRMYLPLAAVMTLAVVGAHALLTGESGRHTGRQMRRTVEICLVAALTVILAQRTIAQNRVYQSDETFWSDVLRKRPNNERAHVALGDNLMQANRLDEAFTHFARALELLPGHALAHHALADVLAKQGKLDEAVAEYRETLLLDSTRVQVHHALGVVFAAQGKEADAIAEFTEAVRVDPRDELAHSNLAVLLAGRGRQDEAIAHFSAALGISRTQMTEYNLGWALVQAGRLNEGRQHLEAAVTLDPAFQPAQDALRTLTSPPPKG